MYIATSHHIVSWWTWTRGTLKQVNKKIRKKRSKMYICLYIRLPFDLFISPAHSPGLLHSLASGGKQQDREVYRMDGREDSQRQTVKWVYGMR